MPLPSAADAAYTAVASARATAVTTLCGASLSASSITAGTISTPNYSTGTLMMSGMFDKVIGSFANASINSDAVKTAVISNDRPKSIEEAW
jgi:hypothetical protein